MCGCYDGDAERMHAESNIFQQKKPEQRAKYKNLDPSKFSQYSYGKN